MIIPIRTDNRLRQRPVINYVLIGLNVAIFLMGFRGGSNAITGYMLDPFAPRLWQFFSSMFLHAGWSHLLGNMLFLWVFGNAVNDRFGHVGYLAFYLAAGVFSGVGYLIFQGTAPALGASGAISGVTGCYLVLFPRVRVTVLVFLFFIMPYEIPSLYFIGAYFLYDLFMTTASAGGGVAYAAHTAGSVSGILMALGLLYAGLLPRDVYDLPSLWKTHRRRAAYKRMINQGYDPFHFTGQKQPPTPPSAVTIGPRRVNAHSVASKARTDTASAEAMRLRTQISQSHGLGDFTAAARDYQKLLELNDQAVLPRQQLLDISNQLMADKAYNLAAEAYESLLANYPHYEHAADIQLMLGIIYGRYLRQTDRAAESLRRAIDGLHDGRKLQMARAELDGLGES